MPSSALSAAVPGLPTISRRHILAAALPLGLAAGLPADGGASSMETPVAEMFRRWLTARIECAKCPSWLSDEEAEPFYLRVTDLMDRIAELQSTCIEDFVMKLAAHTNFFEHSLCDCPAEDALLSDMHWVIDKTDPAFTMLLAEYRGLEGRI